LYTGKVNTLFLELGGVIIVATAFATLARLLRQPPLVAYIVTGVLLGPLGAHFIHNHQLFDALKEVGIALLLFLVGLELNWDKALTTLKTTFLLGTLQVALSFGAGFGLSLLLGQPVVGSIYVGLSVAFSSTVIVVKLLSENRELNSLHGRLAVGFLLFQDIVAIGVSVVIGGLSEPTALPVVSLLGLLILKTASLLVLLAFVSRYLLPRIFNHAARSGELLFLASLAWCFLLALSLSYFGFPLAIGSFLAGISLASLPFSLDILNRLRSLRDFFVIMLFVNLGSSLQMPTLPFAIFSGAILFITILGKPAITFFSLAAKGYRSRTAFFAALTQGQLSELSLLLVATAQASGQISTQLASSIALATIFSILISTSVFTYRTKIYQYLRPMLHLLERKHRSRNLMNVAPPELPKGHIVIFGYHRMGYHILKELHKLHHKVIVVDFNPDIIKKLQSVGVDCLYGDTQDEEIMEQINIGEAAMVISTIPHLDETVFLIEHLAKLKKKPLLIVTSHHVDDALTYYKKGADYVILPHLLGGEHVANLITQYESKSLATFLRSQADELKLLRAKKNALYFD
jgi:Kef-type K+ transport system membrane component KefB/voltage-gated potassium channel Kch